MLRGVTFLGTSSGAPTKYRNVSATVLLFADGGHWLFDCGEGTQHQLQKSNCSLNRIDKIFLTHLHGDHCYGLPGLLCSMSLSRGTAEAETAFTRLSPRARFLEIFGPLNTAQFLRTALICAEATLPFQYRVTELVPSDHVLPVTAPTLHPSEIPPVSVQPDASGVYALPLTESEFSVRATKLDHRIFSLGFVVVEPDRPGSLDVSAALDLGVPKGPLLGKLKAGQSITLDDGTTVEPLNLIGPSRPGRKYVHLGDTSNSDAIKVIARNADWLVHEATFDDDSSQLAIPRGHSTARMAGAFARMVQARRLFLTHFSARFAPKAHDPAIINKILSEAQDESADTEVIAAEDLMFIDFDGHRR